jgi:hypothetical protein
MTAPFEGNLGGKTYKSPWTQPPATKIYQRYQQESAPIVEGFLAFADEHTDLAPCHGTFIQLAAGHRATGRRCCKADVTQ